MKLPAWIAYQGQTLSEDGRSIVVSLRVRRWHPAFWWYLLRHWRDG